MKLSTKIILPIILISALLILLNGCFLAPSEEQPALTLYTVTYNGNENTGGEVPVDATLYKEGDLVTVLGNTGPESLVNTGFDFAGWNTVADASGTARPVGYVFAMGEADVTLYAMWDASPALTLEEPFIGGGGGYVAPPVLLTSIVVLPETMTLFEGESEAILSVTAHYSDGSTAGIALGDCTYASDADGVATVDTGGLVEAVAEGDTIITVTYEDKEDTIEVTVNPILLDYIVVVPETMTLFEGDKKSIKSVTAHYNDGSTAKIPLLTFAGGTPACEIESSDEEVATVLNTGLVTAVEEGTATITVSYTEGSITETNTIAVTVNPILLVYIVVDPETMTLLKWNSESFTITAHYNNGSEADVTSNCTYLTNGPLIARVFSPGVVNSFIGGTAVITAIYTEGDITRIDTIDVTVGPVHNIDQDKYYNTIQAAIDRASDGNTIEVAEGEYVGNLEINVENLTLKSPVQHGAVIQTEAGFSAGSGYGGITILADGVTIDGFRIEQDVVQAVIHTHDTHEATITNNSIIGVSGARPRGIDIGFASAHSDDVLIEGNEFVNLHCGVYVNQGNNLTVEDNAFSDMVEGAVVIDGTWGNTDNILVKDNVATDADYLIFFWAIVGSVTADGNILVNTELTNVIGWLN